MDRFTLIVLERAVELLAGVIQPPGDPSFGNCSAVILRHVEDPACGDEKELYDAVGKLLDIARENHEFLIVGRLSAILGRLKMSGKTDAA